MAQIPSGGLTFTLALPAALPHVERVTAKLSGAPYTGDLTSWNIQAVKTAANDFIVDLRRPMTVTVAVAGEGRVTQVYPWLGTAYTEAPVAGAVQATKLRLVLTPHGDLPDGAALLQNMALGSYPSNLRMTVAGRSPFFFHAGELAGEAEVPDFAAEANRWLQTAKPDPDGFFRLPVTLESDTPGDIELTLPLSLTYSVTVLGTVGGSPELELAAEPGEPVELAIGLTSPGPAMQVSSVSLGLAGDFAQERLAVGQAGQGRAPAAALLAPGVAAAQRLDPGRELACSGIGLYLSGADEPSALQVELREGSESGPGAEPLVTGTVEVARGAPAAWVQVTWPAPVRLGGKPCWAVVKANRGEACWEADPGASGGLVYSADGGRTWRPQTVPGMGALAGRYRLMYQPDRVQAAAPLGVALLAGSMVAASAEVTPRTRPDLVALVPASGVSPEGLKLRLEPKAAGRVRLVGVQVELKSGG